MSRARVDHAHVATCLRASPGRWLFVGGYSNKSSAATTATMIRTASGNIGSNYSPPAAFEARTCLTGEGAVVEARFVGSDRSVPRVRPSRDVERVLGQIARGEVLAGRAGARAIAARHEAAYGAVWARQAAWDDAVRALPAAAPTAEGAEAA